MVWRTRLAANSSSRSCSARRTEGGAVRLCFRTHRSRSAQFCTRGVCSNVCWSPIRRASCEIVVRWKCRPLRARARGGQPFGTTVAMPLGALPRAQLPLAWLCLLRLSHASRCASWCRWDLASSCFKHESCADCDCPAGSQEGCLAWCDGHCEDPKCATCRACKEHRECDPVDRRDAKIEGCASWCSTSFSSEHCGKCSCKACDFCLALYPREDEEPEIEGGDAPPSAAAPIQMTDDLRRAR